MLYDIQAAFDYAWHDGIIFRLIEPAYLIRRIQALLSNRGLAQSSRRVIVPEGEVFSPVLFCLLFNNIPDSAVHNTESKTFTYVDDLAISLSYTNYASSEKFLNEQLGRVHEWLYKWSFKMSVCFNDFDTCFHFKFEITKSNSFVFILFLFEFLYRHH